MISVGVSMKRVLSIRTGSGRVEDEYLRQGRVFKRGGQKGSTWNERILYLQSTTLSFGPASPADKWVESNGDKPASAKMIDSIPLDAISSVVRSREDSETNDASVTPNGSGEGDDGHFNVHTSADSERAGIVYHFRAESSKDADLWIRAIKSALLTMKPRDPTKFERSREFCRAIFISQWFQISMAFLIFANFVVNAVEAQMRPNPAKEEDTEIVMIFKVIDDIFTWLFAFELAINLYANLVKDFITDGWNWFDSIVVTFSLVSFFHPAFEGVNILRLIRALRVFRLFRKLKSLGKILMAIQSSLPAVTNAFFLVLLFTMIYAILGVQFFADTDPENFAHFGLAMYTCFQIMTFDDSAGITRGLWDITYDQGPVIMSLVTFYVVTFQLIVAFILINIVMAVLLEEFAGAAIATKAEELQVMQQLNAKVASPFAGLLEYLMLVDTEERRLRKVDEIFDLLDDDMSERVSYIELRVGLIRIEGISPPVVVTEEIFQRAIVERGFVILPEGVHMSRTNWRDFVKLELREYVTRRASNAVTALDGTAEDKLNAALRALQHLTETTNTAETIISALQPVIVSLSARMDALETAIARAPGHSAPLRDGGTSAPTSPEQQARYGASLAAQASGSTPTPPRARLAPLPMRNGTSGGSPQR